MEITYVNHKGITDDIPGIPVCSFPLKDTYKYRIITTDKDIVYNDLNSIFKYLIVFQGNVPSNDDKDEIDIFTTPSKYLL